MADVTNLEVRDAYQAGRHMIWGSRVPEAGAEFDRWLAAHDAEVLRATANDLADWLGSSDLMADEISDHGIDVILRWLRERAGQVEREGAER
jgi:hypothetical protein